MKCPHCKKSIDDPITTKNRCTQGDVTLYCAYLGLPDSDAEYLFNHWEAHGWVNGSRPIRDWKALIRSWRAAGYLPSQRKALPTPSWREVLRKLYPNYGWIPTNFYDLPVEVKSKIKEHMNNGSART